MIDADFLRLARERYQQGVDGDNDNRTRDEEDRKFYKGDQWDKDAKNKRKNRISVTVNRLPQFVKQITGEMRQNKPAIKVLPVDDKTDPKLAEVYTAIIRHIENLSSGHRVYSKAGEQAVIGGIGWFRILTDYCDGMSFNQEILIKGIRNPLSVVIDPGAIEPVRQDMRWAFVSELMTEESFKAQYPKASLNGFDAADATYGLWRQDKKIRVAEYWQKEMKSADLVLLTNGETMWADAITPEVATQFDMQGIAVHAERKSERAKITCKKITATDILEEYDWEGSFIPLIPVIGEEVEVGDEIFRHGIVYHSRDSQKGYNFARSAGLETAASQPKAPYLVTTKMVAAHQKAWESLNEGNPPVLPYDPDPQAPQGPQRIVPPALSQAWSQEALIADNDMKATTGIYDASLGNRSNETSGVAIRARDSQGETVSYVYVDNLSAAIHQAGKIIIELVPKIYTGERVIRIMGEDDSLENFARINTLMPDGSIGNDISVGQFDLVVTTGPAFATKRAEAQANLVELMRAVPQIAQAVPDLLIKTFDMPYGDKIAERLGVMFVPPGLDEEIDKKRAEIQQKAGPQQPNPMEMLAVEQGKAEIENTQADTVLKQVTAAQKEVQTTLQAYGAGQQSVSGDGPKTAKSVN